MNDPTCEKCGSIRFFFDADEAGEHMLCAVCGTEYPVLIDEDEFLKEDRAK